MERNGVKGRTPVIKLGTRASPLALWQAHHIRDLLQADDPSLEVEIVEIRSDGELYPDQDFRSIGVGVFTRAIDLATREGKVDVAVHSLKDLPTEDAPGLTLACVPPRESPFDAWISPQGISLDELPQGSKFGTSSPRRQAQVLARRPDLIPVPLRGNVQTRLRKMSELGLAGTILAEAGLKRLDRQDLIQQVLDPSWIIPAVAQGALGLVARENDEDLLQRLHRLEDARSRIQVDCERAFLQSLRGGCQIPAGALASFGEQEEDLHLEAIVASPDGKKTLRGKMSGKKDDPNRLGEKLAVDLLGRGAEEILSQIREEQHSDRSP